MVSLKHESGFVSIWTDPDDNGNSKLLWPRLENWPKEVREQFERDQHENS